jgi:hypothetical protein
MNEYHCQAFDADGRRIGGFVVTADTISEALHKASTNIEVAIRPWQFELRVSILRRVPTT